MVALLNRRLRRSKWMPLTGRFRALLAGVLPKSLYARALLIIIAPMVLLQSVVAFVFMERHWQTVTRRLSDATTRDISFLISVYKNYPQDEKYEKLIKMARNDLNLAVQILPDQNLPPVRPKPFFDLLDRTLSNKIRKQIGRPFWIDTVGRSRLVEIRIKLDKVIFRVIARRSQTYASNSYIFLLWMVGTSFVLITVAILFMRNQIKPILRLAQAAERFGKGLPAPADFRPRGAREVRQAAVSFMEMRNRIERQMEQRTTMLAGVSHDLRTVLTRFKLQLAMFGDTSEAKEMLADVDEMQAMLEDYMAFAKGDSSEKSSQVNIRHLLQEIRNQTGRENTVITLKLPGDAVVAPLRQHAFKRAVTNVVSNAVRFSQNITIRVAKTKNWLTLRIDDDGPGIPEAEREEVFRPFYRLDDARGQDTGTNTGLGLSIARDIVRSHGGDITLKQSKMGGLQAIIRVPV
ncbi:MAG TPA: HAMP domain-containing protein [Rhizobiales bacterium]|nr:osmolarity sensor protein EnvZ [bacterium BMS3Bbin10]HDO52574.1 HAMP domain-containing protein [Hyphomicrobiales bacterium]